jgi:cell division septation protein DedD
MRGVFEEMEVQPVAAKGDTELTLSPTTLIMLFFGLIVLCGLCFGVGYATGRRGAQDAAKAPAAVVLPLASQPDSGRPKPSADSQPEASESQAAVADAAGNGTPGNEQTGSSLPSTASAGVPVVNATPSSTTPQVKPAFANTPSPAPPTIAASSPAGPPPVAAGQFMVQIAAVSQQEDADVLMGALRKRGYEVVARREPLDGLIHVRIGPFKVRVEADAWRQKLLNDGYNAIEQQ